MDGMPRLLVAKEVAPKLHVSTWRVYELARQGRIPVMRVGRSLRFPEDALRDWIRRGGTNNTQCHDK